MTGKTFERKNVLPGEKSRNFILNGFIFGFMILKGFYWGKYGSPSYSGHNNPK